jgi:hypothetical protein
MAAMDRTFRFDVLVVMEGLGNRLADIISFYAGAQSISHLNYFENPLS